MNNPTRIQIIGAVLFAVAVLHPFSTKFFEHPAPTRPRHAGLWHLLGEVEVVFGVWAVVLVLSIVPPLAGAVTGGGLTVIANAPNPAGVAILRGHFEDNTINPLGLLVAALPPSLVAVLAFQLL